MLAGQSSVHVLLAAPATTVARDVAVLLDGSAFGSLGAGVLLSSCGSAVSLEICPVSAIVVSAEVPELMFITRVNFAFAPGASEEMVQVEVPPALFAAGNVQFQPALLICPDRKVVLAGVTSVT